MIEWLEGLEDREIARKALTDLREAGADRDLAGWLRWDYVRDRCTGEAPALDHLNRTG